MRQIIFCFAFTITECLSSWGNNTLFAQKQFLYFCVACRREQVDASASVVATSRYFPKTSSSSSGRWSSLNTSSPPLSSFSTLPPLSSTSQLLFTRSAPWLSPSHPRLIVFVFVNVFVFIFWLSPSHPCLIVFVFVNVFVFVFWLSPSHPCLIVFVFVNVFVFVFWLSPSHPHLKLLHADNSPSRPHCLLWGFSQLATSVSLFKLNLWGIAHLWNTAHADKTQTLAESTKKMSEVDH